MNLNIGLTDYRTTVFITEKTFDSFSKYGGKLLKLLIASVKTTKRKLK